MVSSVPPAPCPLVLLADPPHTPGWATDIVGEGLPRYASQFHSCVRIPSQTTEATLLEADLIEGLWTPTGRHPHKPHDLHLPRWRGLTGAVPLPALCGISAFPLLKTSSPEPPSVCGFPDRAGPLVWRGGRLETNVSIAQGLQGWDRLTPPL